MTTRAYEFYRMAVMTGGGCILITRGDWLLVGIGAGLLTIAVILHMTTIGAWIRDDILAELKPVVKP